MSTQPNPFAAYGGTVMPPQQDADPSNPFAAYGGTAMPTAAVQAPQTDPTKVFPGQEGQGEYKMRDAAGKVVPIKYGNVLAARQNGYDFNDENERKTYKNDVAADHTSSNEMMNAASPAFSHPGSQPNPDNAYTRVAARVFNSPLAREVSGDMKNYLDNITSNHPLNNLMHGDTSAGDAIKDPDAGFLTKATAAIMELGAGPELLGGGGGGSEVQAASQNLSHITQLALSQPAISQLPTMAARMKAVTPVIDLMEKNPWLLKYVHLGMHAGAEIALQDMAQGKGAQQSLEEGATAAVGTPVVSKVAGLVKGAGGKLIEALNAPSKGEAAAEAYAQHVQGAVKPTLEGVNEAIGEGETKLPDQTVEHDTGLVDERGQPLKRTETIPGKTVQAMPKIDVGETLDRVGDFNRGRQEIKDALNTVQEQMGPEYRAARDAMTRAEDSGNEQAFEQAQNKLEDAIADSGAKPEMKAALKNGWRNYYGMGKAQQLLDSALSGSPGTIRGTGAAPSLDGKKLLNGLNTWSRNPKFGRSGVAQALGGEERLKSLEELAQKAYTPKGSQMLGRMVDQVGRWVGAYSGFHATGSWAGAMVGGDIGREATNITRTKSMQVMKAVLTNPRIAQAITFAIDSGADPEKVAPGIAAMVNQHLRNQSEDNNNDQSNDGKTD